MARLPAPLILLIMTAVLILSTACVGGQASGDLRAFVIADTHKVTITNYEAQLAADSIPKVLRKDRDTEAHKANIEEFVWALRERERQGRPGPLHRSPQWGLPAAKGPV